MLPAIPTKFIHDALYRVTTPHTGKFPEISQIKVAVTHIIFNSVINTSMML